MRIPIRFPTGWPYALFVCYTEPQPQVIQAQSYDHARMKIGGLICDIKPVMVIKLISDMGHQKTHQFLKGFGSSWMTSDGMVFYKKTE